MNIKKTFRVFGKILEWTIFCVLIFLYAVVLSPNLPTKKYISTYIVQTGSMEPAIRPGSIALIKQMEAPNIKKGDIIVFTSPKDQNQTILHRVFAVKQKDNAIEFETKGDNNNTPDSWTVPSISIKGVCFGTLPLLGHPAAFLKTPKGFAFLFGIPALLLVILQIKKIREGIEEEVQKRVKNIEEKKKKTDVTSVIGLVFLTTLASTLSIQTVKALFTSKAYASSVTFSVKDFVPPNKPTNLHWNNPDVSCGGVTNSYTITADWDDGVDTGGSGIDHYEYNITYPKLGGGTGNWTTTIIPSQYSEVFNADNGIHTYKIRVWDKAGNASQWSDTCTIFYDNTAPKVSLSVTGSPTRIVEDTVVDGEFEPDLSSWRVAGDTGTELQTTVLDGDVPTGDSTMARVGNTSDITDGKYAWENRLMQSFPNQARTLSLYYNFFTRDFGTFDDPGFFIRINGTDIFHQSAWMATVPTDPSETVYSTGWQQFTYNLSSIMDPDINLSISAGNTGGVENQSWVYVDKVTTYFVAAHRDAVYTLSGSDNGSGIGSYHYKIDSGSEKTYISGTPGFSVPPGSHTVTYYSVDTAGNSSNIRTVKVVTDSEPPATPTDFSVDDVSTTSATLSWTASGDDDMAGRAASYDLRYSEHPILNTTDFEQATKSGTVSSPTLAGYMENTRIEGLNPATLYHFALKVFDEAPNASDIATASATTLEGPTNNPGDIIINELMWTGSSTASDDVWLELRNMTDRTITLDSWKLQEYADPLTDTDMYAFPSGTTILPHGFLVISKLDPSVSSLKNTTLTAPTLSLNSTNLRITLVDPLNNTIDVAWNGEPAPADYSLSETYYYSMERMDIPGNGFDQIRWYPCIDEKSKTEFFDGTGIDYGTPGAQNRSENAPLVFEFLKKATDSATIKKPTVTLVHDESSHTVSFTVTGIQSYTSLSWELTYDINPTTGSELNTVQQGAIGKTNVTEETEYKKENIYLGTCSAGGTCVPHTGVKNLKVVVTLKDANGKETIVEKTL